MLTRDRGILQDNAITRRPAKTNFPLTHFELASTVLTGNPDQPCARRPGSTRLPRNVGVLSYQFLLIFGERHLEKFLFALLDQIPYH